MRATLMLAELVTAEGRLDAEAWRAAHTDRTPVARCRCGGAVYTDPAEPEYRVHFGVRWYAMRCQTCTATSELPGTRILLSLDRRPSLAGAAHVRDVERRRLGEDD